MFAEENERWHVSYFLCYDLLLLRVSITSFIFILIIFKLRHVAWIFAGDKLVFEMNSNKKRG